MKICISGLTACGKTTIGNLLAEHYGCKYESFSEFLLDYISNTRKDLIPAHDKNDHFWYHAKELDRYRLETLIDKEIDQAFEAEINSRDGHVILDSFTYPIISSKKHKELRVLIKAGRKIRTNRAFLSSQSISGQKLLDYIMEKDQTTRYLVNKIWEVDIFDQAYDNHFGLILNEHELEKITESFPERAKIRIEIITSLADLLISNYQNEEEKISELGGRLSLKYPGVIQKISG